MSCMHLGFDFYPFLVPGHLEFDFFLEKTWLARLLPRKEKSSLRIQDSLLLVPNFLPGTNRALYAISFRNAAY